MYGPLWFCDCMFVGGSVATLRAGRHTGPYHETSDESQTVSGLRVPQCAGAMVTNTHSQATITARGR